MQRWQFTAGLAGATVLAALIVPSLKDSDPDPIKPIVVTKHTPVSKVGAGTLQISAELDQQALLQGSGDARYLVVDVKAPKLAGDTRRPINIAVVMDTSGSMAARGKMDNARMAAQELVDQLEDGDTFSLITFDDRAQTRITPTSADDPDRLKRLIAGISPGGGTNLYDGLSQGIAQLDDSSFEGVKRVVILSDGNANIGITDIPSLSSLAGSETPDGISVSTLGLGLDFNEDLLSAVSDAGGGSYKFVDRPGMLAEMFSTELSEMTQVAGREVSVDVALPDGVKLLEVYGYEAAKTRDGYQVYLGDVHGGQTRKVVARVQVDDDAVGPIDVAKVTVKYSDAESGEASQAIAKVTAEVTADTRVASASINKDVGTRAARAVVSKWLDASARDMANGDRKAAARKMARGRVQLEQMADRFASAELQEDATALGTQAEAFNTATPGSDDELYQVKKAKEDARGYAH